MQHGEYVFICSKNGALGYSSHCISRSFTLWREKIPELMKGLGKGVKEFKDATNKNENDADKKA